MTSRRRFLTVAACAGATAALPPWVAARARPDDVSDWRGSALGAPARMTLVHPDRDLARRTIDACVSEIDRLEAIFSLYRPDSALVRLNREGTLEHPPLELLELMSFALSLARQTHGAFDPTVQPLYQVFARHFTHPHADPAGPERTAIEQVLDRVGYDQVELDTRHITLHRPGMALTLNGVAQGYITDRIGKELRRAGFQNLLIDIGEIHASGCRPDGQPWRAAVADPGQADRTLFRVALGDRPGQLPALATSSGSGSPFAPSTSLHHLLDPRTGTSASHHAAVTVAAPRAAIADGLSTALSVTDLRHIPQILSAWPTARAWLVGDDGRLKRHGAHT